MKKVISTPQAPAAIGPYSQAVRSGNTLYTSGQIPLDPKTGELIGTNVTEQAEQSLKNLFAVLSAENMTADNVVKTTVFLTDMADFADFNAVYAKYFSANFPARSCIAVLALPKFAKVEIEAIAVE